MRALGRLVGFVLEVVPTAIGAIPVQMNDAVRRPAVVADGVIAADDTTLSGRFTEPFDCEDSTGLGMPEKGAELLCAIAEDIAARIADTPVGMPFKGNVIGEWLPLFWAAYFSIQ